MGHIYYFQRDGPSEEKIYEACKRSIAELDNLDNEEKVQNGEHPYVSAIILDKDGNILKDDKGKELIELTDPKTKKHAEAKLIERLLLAGNTDDLLNRAHTLIVTLEPCATRDITKHPEEIACAKLIAYAGIKQVIVGMLDPAIEVSGRGLKILDERGISYTFFPFSLIKKLKNKNKKYIYRSEIELMSTKISKISQRIYNPNAEMDLMNAPRSIRNFMDDESNRESLKEIFNNFFNRYPTKNFKKYCIKHMQKFNPEDYIKYYPLQGAYDLAKFITSQYQDQTIQDFLNKMKRDHVHDYLNKKDQIAGINFTIYEKIAQYLGINIHEKEINRDALILFFVLQWGYNYYF